MTQAHFSTVHKTGTVTMGNFCTMSGDLIHPNEKEPVFKLINLTGDGVGCPDDVHAFDIVIVDGYVIHALGNASKIEVRHQKSANQETADFNGVYDFVGE